LHGGLEVMAGGDVVVKGVRKVVRHGCSAGLGGGRVRTREDKKVMGRRWLLGAVHAKERYYNG